jgi:hypothetical protein
LRSFPEASFPTLQFISKLHNVHIRDVISIILSHWLVDCCLTSIEFKMYRYILFDVSYKQCNFTGFYYFINLLTIHLFLIVF